jgi:hypothetical protein
MNALELESYIRKLEVQQNSWLFKRWFYISSPLWFIPFAHAFIPEGRGVAIVLSVIASGYVSFNWSGSLIVLTLLAMLRNRQVKTGLPGIKG